MLLIVKATGERISVDELKRRNGHVSFPAILNDEVLGAFGCATVNAGVMPVAKIGEQVVEVAPKLVDGVYVAQYEVVPMTFTATETTDAEGNPVTKTAAEVEAEFVELHKGELAYQVSVIAKEKRDAVVAGISPAEMASWGIKRAEAIAYEASHNVADAPNLSMEATARGVALDILVDKVLAKANALAALEAHTAGTEGKHLDAIKAISNLAELQAYDVKAGW